MGHNVTSDHEHNTVRRSGNYSPTIWHFDYIESLESNYAGNIYTKRIEKLKEEVRMMLDQKEEDRLAQLKHVDMLQRLGIAYHFLDEIRTILEATYCKTSSNDPWKKNNLYGTTLEFRLLRQYGYWVSSEVFNVFKDKTGNFKECMCEDIIGMLSLHETTFYMVEGEVILEEARDFTARHLQEYIKRNNKESQNDYLGILVSHELELPLHWRMRRLEARWFIDMYGMIEDMNPTLLELAKYDFNVVQSTYLEDLKHASRWWNSTRLGQKMNFSRDRLVETFLWTVGAIFEPQFGYCRRILTRVGALITVIDDIYDVYGTLDELKLFEDVLERWDINDMDELPDYMKLCFLATFNAVNEIAFDVLKEQGSLVIKYLKKMWIDVCKRYMVEAKWYYSGHTPTLQEYIENGWVSITIPLILVHLYCCITNPITQEEMEFLVEYPNIIRQSSTICRLADDLGTSSDELKRGDNPKSIQCYMHETGASEDEARQYIKYLIGETWKQMNKERFAKSPLSQTFVEAAVNVARIAMCIYENGDGQGVHQERYTKSKILSLFVDPIPL